MADNDLLALIAGTLGTAPADVHEHSDTSNTRKLNSLRQIMLMSELGTHYNLELSDKEIWESTSVTKIRAVLSGRSAG